MAKKGKPHADSSPSAPRCTESAVAAGRPSSLLDTRLVYCGLRRSRSSRDNLEQLPKLPDAWLRRSKSSRVDLIYIDPAPVSEVELPLNSNRTVEQIGGVFWGETKEKRAFEDRHASTQPYIEYMRPRCVQLARVLKKTGSFN